MTDAVAALAALAQRLVRAPQVLDEVLDQFAEEVLDLIKAGHDAGEDPYGERWDQKSDGSDSHLFDSGNLRSGWHVSQKGSDSFTVSPTAFYAKVHQGGKLIRAKTSRGLRFKIGGRWVTKRWVRIPPRPMVPDSRGLPAEWQEALTETAEVAMEHLLGK